jgi:hypothetical protein
VRMPGACRRPRKSLRIVLFFMDLVLAKSTATVIGD